MSLSVRRYWGPRVGWQEAIDPQDATVPGFEAFEFFTCGTKYEPGFRLTEASTGLSVLPPDLPSFASFLTRDAALAEGIATLESCGVDEFLNKVLNALRQQGRLSYVPVQEAA